MMRKVHKAVFPVAGFGTRFLPVTKAMPKELLPIVDKPLIQYAAEEAIAAGIDTLIFVTGRNKRALEDHFDNNLELEMALRSNGKDVQADMVKNILPGGVECVFVRQPEPLGLGHAVLCAERVVGKDPFAVLLADDFLTGQEPGATTELVNNFETSGKMQLSVSEVRGNGISNYGVVALGNKPGSVVGIVEKPDPESAPSNWASIGRYILTPEIFVSLRAQPADASNEIQLTDALHRQALSGNVSMVPWEGKRFDCGSVPGYVQATQFVAHAKGILPKS
jgi:UTP--glucose-1-phosphate uridylyltransferase